MKIKKNNSLKLNLIFKLNIVLLIISTLVFIVSFNVGKSEINQVFDAELIKSARLIFELTKHETFIKNSSHLDEKLHQKFFNRYDYELHAQVWKNNKIIYNSGEYLNASNPTEEGFKDIIINQENWRSFAFFDKINDTRILVIEKFHIRENLIFEIALASSIALFLLLFFIIIVVILVVNKELKSLKNLADEVSLISLAKIKKIEGNHLPEELKPFINSFNSLIEKLLNSLENEKRFTDYAAHELNTPLTAIRLQAQILLNQNHNKNHRQDFENLIEAVDGASHLINQLLTLSRINGELDKNSMKKISVINLINEIIENFTKEISQKNLKIIKNFENISSKNNVALHKIYCQILFKNLLDNAIKYSPDDSEITIDIEKNIDNISIKICNYNDNISSIDSKKVFENFYRSNKSKNTRNIVGSGLGLAIAKKIVKLHNGSISFNCVKDKVVIEIFLKNF
jgi:two-component system sensor histidine kinase QseC